ncbi:MAG: acyl-CoA dehydratase activase [Candidatus Latescibacterota bacterium]
MGVYIGCDIGTVSVKAVAVVDSSSKLDKIHSSQAHRQLECQSPLLNGSALFLSQYFRISGNPLHAALEVLGRLTAQFPAEDIKGLRVTGSGARLVGNYLGVPVENEFRSIAWGVGALHPDVSYIFEMGGENSKFLNITVDPDNNAVGISDYETNGDCAAGTGSFMDQQASRLRYNVEEIGDLVASCAKSAKIAGRCSVFAKSDMIHAQQKGATPPEILKGLCEAVARNFKGNIARGREVTGKTAFVGGVARNKGIVEALRGVFELTDQNMIVPQEPAFYSAVGAALLERSAAGDGSDMSFLRLLDTRVELDTEFPAWDRLTLDNVRLLRQEAKPYHLPEDDSVIDAYLGVDVGSVSTNLVCIDENKNVIHEIYLRTQARPVEVVGNGLKEIEEKLGKRIAIKGVGTTGSGRELIGELIGADTVNDEITAHKTGAAEISETYLSCEADTIFEIGGQDSKYISVRDGVVVDFTMNEACAAGTGSFLEEQAEKLDVNIINEFAELAFEAKRPIRLGERCTVYMEQDVTSYQQRGADKKNLIAGLAYSVVQNYLNRVVRGRPVGDVIFFQGGTAYNDSVAAAFSTVLGRQIIVPPHNGVVGAYGAALLAREKALALKKDTSFRGYRIDEVDYEVREFMCKACTNYCDIQEFKVEGNKTYWGDKCSEKYRKEAKTPKKPVIPDLLELRDKALMQDYFEYFLSGNGGFKEHELAKKIKKVLEKRSDRHVIGAPRAMYFYDRHPFWGTYLNALGFQVVVSDPTTKQLAHMGIEEAVAEPCYPIQIAHGHAGALIKDDVDYLFLPNAVNAESEDHSTQSYLCPWGQTLPYVIAASPLTDNMRTKILAPLVHFREGAAYVERELWSACKEFASSRKHHRAAVTLAYAAQTTFARQLQTAGREALAILKDSGEIGIIIVGRPYNIYDKGINLNVPAKLRKQYGVNVIPIDFLPLAEVGIHDLSANMFWNYGRKILQAARLTSQDPNLHIIYITNFKCGPDSYVKEFAADAAVKPFLTLQFDAHGNDAGMMTRCEAYLDSKGVLRWWKGKTPSKEEPSTSPEWEKEALEHSLQPSAR